MNALRTMKSSVDICTKRLDKNSALKCSNVSAVYRSGTDRSKTYSAVAEAHSRTSFGALFANFPNVVSLDWLVGKSLSSLRPKYGPRAKNPRKKLRDTNGQDGTSCCLPPPVSSEAYTAGSTPKLLKMKT
mmetsp:Transcript_20031/g.35746  ORF Transcript_20031/g.35746 Transcript_20031/m.35746 type:complete len:130 (+) Transcript_20031:484-873(+)